MCPKHTHTHIHTPHTYAHAHTTHHTHTSRTYSHTLTLVGRYCEHERNLEVLQDLKKAVIHICGTRFGALAAEHSIRLANPADRAEILGTFAKRCATPLSSTVVYIPISMSVGLGIVLVSGLMPAGPWSR